MLRKLIVFGATLFHVGLSAQVIEIEGIESVSAHLNNHTLVLLNVGDVLFSPSSMLADNQWREYFVDRVNQTVVDQKIGNAIIDEVKGIIVEQIPKVPPEQITPRFINALQECHVPVIGYSQRNFSTTYAPNNGLIVSNHLLGMGIDLAKNLPFTDYSEAHDFKYGIIFTNKQPVGAAVRAFLAKQSHAISRVVLVDDSIEALQEVESALANDVEVIGLRYGYIDERKKTFDADLATLEFFAYINDHKLLSDDEAKAIQKQNPSIQYEVLLDEWIMERAHRF